MPDNDKRGKQPEVPFGYEALLTNAQRRILDERRELGWSLYFIRRSNVLAPTVVISDPADGKSWQILDNGELIRFSQTRRPR